MLQNSGSAVHLAPIHLSPPVHDSLVKIDHLWLTPQVQILSEVLVYVGGIQFEEKTKIKLHNRVDFWEDWFHLEGLKLELGLAHVAGEEVELACNDNNDDEDVVL